MDRSGPNRTRYNKSRQNGPNKDKVVKTDQIGLKQTNGPNKTEVDQSRQNGLNGTK